MYNPAKVRVLGDKTRGPRATHSPPLLHVPCRLLGLYRSRPFHANQAARCHGDYRCAQYFFRMPRPLQVNLSWLACTSNQNSHSLLPRQCHAATTSVAVGSLLN